MEDRGRRKSVPVVIDQISCIVSKPDQTAGVHSCHHAV